MIEVKHLTKRYGEHTAVEDLNFTIGKGQIYGFLGPNGAGKSTTMNMITGCLSASRGSITVGGFDIYEQADQAKRLIGYLPEQPPVYPERTPREYLCFVARAKGIGKDRLGKEVARVMQATELTQVADRLIKHLSKGYRQRVGIAQALLGDPQIIILDEPTVGLDPLQITQIRDLIRSLGKDHTVILSSHILSEIRAVCNRVLIINRGKLLACDSLEALEQRYATTVQIRAVLETEDPQALLAPLEIPYTLDSHQPGRCQVAFTTAPETQEQLCRALFRLCAQADAPILEMNVQRRSLEDIFLALTDGKEAN